MKSRNIFPFLLNDLKKKMVLLSGPRQCGKTTLAEEVITALKSRGKSYYNWDIDADRMRLKKSELDPTAKLWVLDETHKNRNWRNWLKGVYDQNHKEHSILVTGSAQLDLFSRGGDSLQGRYYWWRLHPFTLAEAVYGKVYSEEPDLSLSREISSKSNDTLRALFELGGYPEPFLGGSEVEAKRWRLQYGQRVLREEIRSLEQVMDVDKIETLFETLPRTVGSPLSINSLGEDVEASFKTLKNWISILERLYGVFRIHPYGPPKVKALKKEAKLYFWDWRRVDDEGVRFENLIASHLLKLCHWIEDRLGEKAELRYFRGEKKQEVDFVLLRNGKPWFAVEAKLKEQGLDPSLKYFMQRAPFALAFQVALHGDKDYYLTLDPKKKIRITTAKRFLSHLF